MTTTLTWRDTNGVATVLNEAAGYKLLRGTMGLGVAAPQNVIDNYSAFDGAVLTKKRRNTQSVILPLLVRHATRAQTLIEQLASTLDVGGELEYTDGVNTRTLRNVIYEGGLGGNLAESPNPAWRKVAVALLALDPWWYGLAQSQVLSTAAPTTFDAAISFDSVVPFDGGGSVAVPIIGDVESYPVFTVIGPATTLVVGSGGLAWSIAAPLGASDTLVVDHRPNSRGPRKNGGSVDWSLLTAASRLFPLAVGTTAVITGATGTTGATQLIMSFEPRYLTP